MTLRVFVLICVSFVSSAVFAVTGPLSGAPSDKAGYDILKDFYEGASSPATMDQFAALHQTGVTNPFHCVGFEAKAPFAEKPFNRFLKVTKEIAPAYPPAGPLLPGSPVKLETKLFSGNGLGLEDLDAKMWGLVTNETTPTDLVVKIDNGFFEENIGASTYLMRKRDGMVVFNLSVPGSQSYGYCYQLSVQPWAAVAKGSVSAKHATTSYLIAPSKEEAERNVVSACNDSAKKNKMHADCKVMASVQNGCILLALGVGDRYFVATSATDSVDDLAIVYKNVKAKCEKSSSGCGSAAFICSNGDSGFAIQ